MEFKRDRDNQHVSPLGRDRQNVVHESGDGDSQVERGNALQETPELGERASQLLSSVGEIPEVDEMTVREMIKSGREFKEHGPTLSIEIAVVALGIRHDIAESLNIGFKRDTLCFLREMIRRMLIERDSTWDIVSKRMLSAPKGTPPDAYDCAGDDEFRD